MPQAVTIDFETRSACDLKNSGAWVYSEHPTTEILCLWFCGHPPDKAGEMYYTDLWTPGCAQPFPLQEAIDRGILFECHNSMFERAIWTNIMVKQYGWPEIPPEQWHDTMAMCARKALPLNLDAAGQALKLQVTKDKEGAKALLKICKPISVKDFSFNDDPVLLQKVIDYGKTDVLTQMHLSRKLGYLEPREREIWLLNQRMNLRGIRIDLSLAADCQAVYDEATGPLKEVFAGLTGGLKAGSRKVRDLINAEGCSFPNLQKETVEDALENWKLPDKVRTILEVRRALTATSISKLKKMRDGTCNDGRARGLIQYHGATTGRDSGRLLQPLNFPRGSLPGMIPHGNNSGDTGEKGPDVPVREYLIPTIQRRDIKSLVERLAPLEKGISPEYRKILAPVTAITNTLRSCLIAGEGRLLCVGDFNTIEVRMLLGIAGQSDKLELLRQGADPYCDLASRVLGRPINKKDHPLERQNIGKPGVLGLGFQMGAPKFLNQYGQKDWDLDFAKNIVDIYRQEWAPEVVKLWYGLQEASNKAVYDRTPQEYNGIVYQIEDEWLTARLHSERKLYYFQPRKVTREMPWSTDNNPDFRTAWTYTAMKQNKLTAVDAYGGLLAENVAQAEARDLMYDRALVADAEGFPLILTVYDELVTEPLTERACPETLRQIMIDAPDWVKQMGIPIAADDCWAGERYRK